LSSSGHTISVFFTLPWISSAYAGTGLRRRSFIKAKIFWNKLLGTATSTSWNVTYRPCLTTFAKTIVGGQCRQQHVPKGPRMRYAPNLLWQSFGR
jgi:hypothetical protein